MAVLIRISTAALAVLGLSLAVHGSAEEAPPREKSPEPSQRTFAAIDKNEDGKISAAEAREERALSTLFSGLDGDKDGFISRAEFAAYDPANAANAAKNP